VANLIGPGLRFGLKIVSAIFMPPLSF
jgi:hypothetical protein